MVTTYPRRGSQNGGPLAVGADAGWRFSIACEYLHAARVAGLSDHVPLSVDLRLSDADPPGGPASTHVVRV